VPKKRPVVLVAGIARSSFDELAPVLDRHKVTVVQVTSAEDSTLFAHSERVELVILAVEPTTMSLEDVVRTIRSESSASNKTSLLVLATPGKEDEARRLIGRGVNRVMLTVDPPKFVSQQVADLLDIAPRTTLRLTTRLLVELADGSEEALAAVVNMSADGVLLETDADLEPGQHVILSIDIDNQDEPVSARAEVVRKADPDRDGMEGIGVRFLRFEGDSRERLEAILGEAFHIPIDEVRTTS
jgi:response regulator RpfG family c-di-GMP phosphodiesterase